MAMTVLSDFSAALSLYLRPKLATQINSVSVLPFLLPVMPGQGKNLSWTVEFTGAANAVASAEGVVRDSTDADDEIEVPATLEWAQYDKTSSVSDKAQAAAGSNLNPESIGAIGSDLLAGKVQRQIRRLGLGIARDLYAGDPAAAPTQVAGADLAINSSTTFAGIDPVTYTEWSAVEAVDALAALSLQRIREFFTDIYDACGMMPEFCTVPSPIYNAIRGLYTDYEAHVIREVSLARGGGIQADEPRVVKLAAGMRAIEVDQVPVVLDKWATADTMFAWNTECVELQQLDPLFSILQGGQSAVQDLFRRLSDNPHLQLPKEQLEGMAARGPGIRPHIKVLGDRGLSSEAVIACWPQVKWKRRNAFGKFTFTA